MKVDFLKNQKSKADLWTPSSIKPNSKESRLPKVKLQSFEVLKMNLKTNSTRSKFIEIKANKNQDNENMTTFYITLFLYFISFKAQSDLGLEGSGWNQSDKLFSSLLCV